MTKKKSQHRTFHQKLARGVAILGILYALASVGAAWAITSPWPFGSSRPPSNFTEIQLTTSDGVTLNAHSFESHSAPLVVLAHDYHSSSGAFQEFAALLTQNGYDVLAFDFRGHGNSDAATVSRGVFEVEDVAAVFRYIQDQRGDRLSNVAWVGVGSGAAAVSFHEDAKDLGAVVLVNCYADLEHAVSRGFEATVRTGLRPLGSLMTSVVEWRLGSSLRSIRPIDEMKKLRETPVLVVQSETYKQGERNVGELLAESAGPDAELFIHYGAEELLDGLATGIAARRAILEFLEAQF